MTIQSKLVVLPPEAVVATNFEEEPDTLDCQAYTEDAMTQFGRASKPYSQLATFWNDPIWVQDDPPLTEAFLRSGWDRSMQAMQAIISSYTAIKIAREHWLRVAATKVVEIAESALQGIAIHAAQAARDEAYKKADELIGPAKQEQARFEQCQLVLMLKVFGGYAHYYGLQRQQLSDLPLSSRRPVPLPDLDNMVLDAKTKSMPN
jgi:hypothetical protein